LVSLIIESPKERGVKEGEKGRSEGKGRREIW
jgi:hypothetical protein